MNDIYQTSKDTIQEEKDKFASIIPSFEKFKGWANEFEMASLERKKAIVNLLINNVNISKSGITVQFNIDYQQFLGKWENEIIPFDKFKTA